MITNHTFTKDWLLAVNHDLGWSRQETQLKNVEKAIAALHLLEMMAAAGLSFIFKGGTSLLLLLQRIYRLSVDVDVVMEEPFINAEEVFAGICERSNLFTGVEKRIRDAETMPDVTHYKFFYRSFADTTEASYILLDIYRSANDYARIVELEIDADILDTGGKNMLVRVPDIDSLLGDKLTAFAPGTIGVSLTAEPGRRQKRIEVLKQLFDVGILFNPAMNIESIRKTHKAIAEHEIARRGLDVTVNDVLRDSAFYAFVIGYRGEVEKPIYDTIAKGYRDFNKFVSDLSFDESQAVLAASKVAYIAHILLAGGRELEKYSREIDMGSWSIQDRDFMCFNEYKYSNPEAFFYWYKALAAAPAQ